MRHGSIDYVSVLLDELSSDDAIVPALDWASRLALPLRVAVISSVLANAPETHNNGDQHAVSHELSTGRLQSWELACAQRGVTMETTNWFRTPGDAVDHFLRPGGLCVVEGHRANATRQALLARLERAPEIPMLMAPATHQRMSRVLVVHDRHDPGASFLESAVRLCQALEIQPLILTLASSERGALLKQRVAEGVCARLDLPADFDAAVSLGVRAAVDRAARWRNCSHVFFERTNGATGIRLWQRPLDILSQWRGISDSLALLALPAGLTLDFPKKTYSGRFGRFWNSPGSAATKLASTNGTNASEVTRDKP